jgi:hypothetical protein
LFLIIEVSLTRESIVSKISRSHSNDHPSKQNSTIEQRKTIPSTIGSSSSTKKNTSVVIDREAEDIEKLYMQLKAKQSMEKRKK